MSSPNFALERVTAVIDNVLISGGYRRVSRQQIDEWPLNASAFEDPYSIVGLWTWPSIDQLIAGWYSAQEFMLRLINDNVASIDAKAWDGYLVLFSPSVPLQNEVLQLENVRYNTRRLRKIVITSEPAYELGPEVDLLTDLDNRLAPLLPLRLENDRQFRDPLSDLRDRIARHGGNADDLDALLAASRTGRSLVTALHDRINDRGA